MKNHLAEPVDDIARRSPSALAMALERAIVFQNMELERAVLSALEQVGITVVDRGRLTAAVQASRGSGGGR